METMDITTDDGKEKTCFVAYSLGNFFSSQSSSYASGCEESVILNLQFTKNGETGETALTNVSYTPLYLLDSGKDADGQPLRDPPHPHSHRLRPVPEGNRTPDKRHQPPAHKDRVGL